MHGVAFAELLFEPGDIHRTGGFSGHQFASVNRGMAMARPSRRRRDLGDDTGVGAELGAGDRSRGIDRRDHAGRPDREQRHTSRQTHVVQPRGGRRETRARSACARISRQRVHGRKASGRVHPLHETVAWPVGRNRRDSLNQSGAVRAVSAVPLPRHTRVRHLHEPAAVPSCDVELSVSGRATTLRRQRRCPGASRRDSGISQGPWPRRWRPRE